MRIVLLGDHLLDSVSDSGQKSARPKELRSFLSVVS